MNQFKVNKKELIKACDKAIKNADKNIEKIAENGNHGALGIEKAIRNQLFSLKTSAESPLVEEIFLTQESFKLVNDYLTLELSR